MSSKLATPSRSIGVILKEVSKAESVAAKKASKVDSSSYSTVRTSNTEYFKSKGKGHMMKDCQRKVLLTQDGYVAACSTSSVF